MITYTDNGKEIIIQDGNNTICIPKDESNKDYQFALSQQKKGEAEFVPADIPVAVVQDPAEVASVVAITEKADADQPVTASEIREFMALVAKTLGWIQPK